MTHREQHTAAERPGGQPVEPDPRAMDRDALRAYLRTTHTVSLWPFAGRALGNLSRPATYRAAANGGIRTLSLGCRTGRAQRVDRHGAAARGRAGGVMSTMSVCGIDYEVSPMCTVEGNVDYFLEHGEPTVDEFRAACVHVGRVYAPHLLYCLWCENLITVNVLTASIGGIWSAAEFPDCAARSSHVARAIRCGRLHRRRPSGRTANEAPLRSEVQSFHQRTVAATGRGTDDMKWPVASQQECLAVSPPSLEARVAPWRLLARNVNSRPGESEYVIDDRPRISHADRDQDAQ